MGTIWKILLTQILVTRALASPAPEVNKRRSLPTLSQDQINAFRPFTLFTSAAYCNPSATLTWICGANCEANPGFQPFVSGGDGSTVQYWYVGWDPVLDAVIVAHQGTNPKNFESVLTDLDFPKEKLDQSMFPGIGSSIEVHTGFADAHARTAPQILSAVQTVLAEHSSQSVVITGHSLGASLSLLDAVYLPFHLPPTVSIRTICYGLPRVGNQAFADYVDTHVQLTHINNKKDPVPTVPFQFLGFRHPSGEVHIDGSNAWVECSGQENPSTECIDGAVEEIWDGDLDDHDGPYDGITIGC